MCAVVAYMYMQLLPTASSIVLGQIQQMFMFYVLNYVLRYEDAY